MAVVAPGQDPQQQHQHQHHHPPQQTSSQSAPHGKKRAAEHGLETEQRLSKRFDLLNIDNGTRLYIPVAGNSGPDTSRHLHLSNPRPIEPLKKKKTPRLPRPPPDDSMQVEDTPNRVYIHDLAAELSDLESDEENPIFLSDIEKHIAKIPLHVLRGPAPNPAADNALVLYNVPSSLSVPEEKDSVRKAIAEARERVRERQARPAAEHNRVKDIRSGLGSNVKGTQKVTSVEPDDEDAMDID